MAIDLNTLVPDFRALIDQLLANCSAAGYVMEPNYAIRTPVEQGALWRQSRTGAVVAQEIQSLRDGGFDFLADSIENAGPRNGEHVTNTIPGLSWHQWGEALDCVWVVDGEDNWSTTQLVNGKNGYAVYADEAANLGLFPGGHWTNFKDWPHVQFRSAGSALAVMTMQEINDTMQERFGA